MLPSPHISPTHSRAFPAGCCIREYVAAVSQNIQRFYRTVSKPDQDLRRQNQSGQFNTVDLRGKNIAGHIRYMTTLCITMSIFILKYCISKEATRLTRNSCQQQQQPERRGDHGLRTCENKLLSFHLNTQITRSRRRNICIIHCIQLLS